MKPALMATLLLVVVPALPLSAGAAEEHKPHEQALPIDLRSPSSWKAAIERQTADLDKIAVALISVAEDEGRSPQVRRQAIVLLGRIGSSRALDFLVSHIGMELPLTLVLGDGDMVRGRPCTYALSGIADGKRNWNAVPLLLRYLSKPATRKQQELMDFAFLLRRICGKSTARQLLAHQHSKASQPTVVRNLQGVSRYLQ